MAGALTEATHPKRGRHRGLGTLAAKVRQPATAVGSGGARIGAL